MTDESKIKDAIKCDERWLAELCEKSVEIDTTAIKHRVRIEIGEQWLARKLERVDDPDMANRLRQKTRAEISERSRREKPCPAIYRLYYAATGAIAVAAMLALVFSDMLLQTSDNLVPASGNTSDESYVDAFEQYEDDAWDTSLAQLSGELDEFDVTIEPTDWSDSSSAWFDTEGTDG